ncbi:hypothetical protein [Mycolicibacterium sp.]|uniref:hypothetical protein n=1 Tax=Mycolicibacterium sp. TaxID=2320850 RepID=UPI00093AD309|nr:hypothetical protein EB73_07710 [Mycobacterium sp. SWH-M3]
MCGEAISDAWNATTGFVEDVVETTGNFLADNPLVTIPLMAIPGLQGAGLLPLFSDYTPYDGEYKSGDGLIKLDGLPAGYPKDDMEISTNSNVYTSFEEVERLMRGAQRDVTPGHGPLWEDIANLLTEARNNYHTFLRGMEGSDNDLAGKTSDAAKKNITASFNQIDGASKAAKAMVQISPAFSKTIENVIKEISDRAADYYEAMRDYPEHQGDIRREYDVLAKDVLTDYTKNIDLITTSNPDLTGGTASPQHPGPPASQKPPTNYGGPSNTGGGSPSKGSGAGKPDLSGLKNTSKPTFDPTKLQPQTTTPQQTTPQATTPSLPTSGLTDAAKAAQDAASQGLDAAKQAMDQALGNNQNPSGLPEGVLGLGPKGLSGAAKGTAGGGRAGGGSGSGSGARTSPLARNAGTSTAATTKGTGATTTAARSGISAGSGAPGAGAPAAGHRGNGADGSVHKANKALRRKKNGEDVMGDTEAVVAVVGDEAQEPRMVVPAAAEK